MRAGNMNRTNCPEYDDIPDKWLSEDSDEMKKTIRRIACELIGSCAYCTMISSDPDTDVPITCVKLAALRESRLVSIDTCLDCGEFRK
ncbi:hypothetical protein [Paenibacillus thermotolerans]|uniref:hypothetical protein n=1 Tax=Paenibacillus thermotolerans TaxID=3027807 RepID=UPI002367DF34|nr:MULTISPECIES: hypothetical protein [unclassified Paenibacillus]